MTFSQRSHHSLIQTYRSDICSRAGIQMLYTEMLTAVMRMATPTLRRYALFLSVRRMEHRLTIICKRNWTWRAHVVTEGEVRKDINDKKPTNLRIVK